MPLELPVDMWICRHRNTDDALAELLISPIECWGGTPNRFMKNGCECFDGKPCDARKAILQWAVSEED